MRRLVAWILIVGSLATLGHVLAAAIGPTSGTRRVAAQVRWLDRASVRDEANALLAGFEATPTGLLSSYPGGYWPCDNVVGLAALHRADTLVDVPGTDAVQAAWTSRLDALRDQATGLLPHQTDAGGTALDGPRATSQTIIQTFWPEVDPALAARDYARYRDTFVVGSDSSGCASIRTTARPAVTPTPASS